MIAVWCEIGISGSLINDGNAKFVSKKSLLWDYFLSLGPMTQDDYIEYTKKQDRKFMIASRRQIRLALGEAGCDAMDAAANDLAYPWAIREQMKSAHEWHRTAQEIDEFGWIMGLSADEIDALFLQAMAF